MHRYQIRGFITPISKRLSIPGKIGEQVKLPPFEDELTISTSILDGRFSAECSTHVIGREHFWSILNYVHDFLNIQLYLISMAFGSLFDFQAETVSIDNGPDEDIVGSTADLSEIFKSLKTEKPGKLNMALYLSFVGTAGQDLGLITAIRAVQRALHPSGERTISCARAIEALRNSMFGLDPSEAERSKAWKVFRENLNISRAYLDSCIHPSRFNRHGSSTMILPDIDKIVLTRTTEIIHRYFCFKMGGNRPLSVEGNPELV